MYVELQTISNFSFLRGASHPEELIKRAAELGYDHLAITDLNSLAGVVRAHVAAKESKINLLVGSHLTFYKEIPTLKPTNDVISPEVIPQDSPTNKLPFSLLVYPTSRNAYGRLCSLLTLGKRRAPKGSCYLTRKDLEQHSQGLVAIVVVDRLEDKQLFSHLTRLKNIFDGDRLSLAISQSYGPQHYQRVSTLVEIGKLSQIPLVATNNVYYHEPERRKLQDVLTCIRRHTDLENAGYLLFANAERFLKPPAELARLFAKIPQAIERTREIALLARSFSLDQLKYQYPKEICPEDKTPIEYLKELSIEGAKQKYPKGIPQQVKKLIEHEISLVKELGYAQYFLTVYDIVEFAKSQQILCQGRGAAANSAICYCLGITSVDPEKIKLLFERFVSKERNEPPDIDVDFEHERREEVIQYIYQKYGRTRAALVASVITYRTKSAVRDIGKTFSLSEETILLIIKALRRSEGPITKKDLSQFGLDANNSGIINTIKLTRQLKGFPRHLSQHVGGFIVSQEQLSEIVPIENAAMPGRTVIEWDKDDIDALGMFKIDILALGMLTCIRKAFDLVNSRAKPEEKLSQEILQLHSIPPEDPAVYDMICKAETIGVFQIESRAQMSMLPRLRPRCFYDLVVEVAIVRPGPIQGGMVHPYLQRRNSNKEVQYPNPKIKEILQQTLGVPIFQEQVMELAIVAGGFTPGQADELRRAMASWKKKGYQVAKIGERLMQGMIKNGYSHQFAKQVFQQIKGFGEYGFPQSHAASFALLVYISSWLKKHHSAEFTAALLNSQPMGFYRPAQLIKEAQRERVQILPIDVNFSDWDCTIEGKEPAIRLGMKMAKSIPKKEAIKISQTVKRNGHYQCLNRLWKESGATVSCFRSLARADAFRSMGLNRQRVLWDLKKFSDNSLPLFEHVKQKEDQASLPVINELSQTIKDYQATGLSLKAHPISFLRRSLEQNGVSSAEQLKEESLHPGGSRVSIAGLVLVRQRPMTASGIMFMTIEDETSFANLIIKPRVFKSYQDSLCESSVIVVTGRVQREREVIHVLVEESYDASNALMELTSQSRDFR